MYEISDLAETKHLSASEMTRKLWQNYFNKIDKIEWQKEVAEW